MVLEVVTFLVEEILGRTVLLTGLIDQFIALPRVFDCILPLKVQLMSLCMKSLELLCGLIKLDLGGLSLCHLLFKFFSLPGYLNSKFFDVKSKFLNLGLISTAILLEGQVILFLLSGSEGPLLELLLVPVHLKLELIHLLVCLEDHILDIVQTILLIGHALLQFLNLIFKSSALPFSDLFEMFLGFDLLVLDVNE